MHRIRKLLLIDIFWLVMGMGLCSLYIYYLSVHSTPWWSTMLFALCFLLQATAMWRGNGPGIGAIALTFAAMHSVGQAFVQSSPNADLNGEIAQYARYIQLFYIGMAVAPFWVLIKNFKRKRRYKKTGLLF